MDFERLPQLQRSKTLQLDYTLDSKCLQNTSGISPKLSVSDYRRSWNYDKVCADPDWTHSLKWQRAWRACGIFSACPSRSCAILSVTASPSKGGCLPQKLSAAIKEPVPGVGFHRLCHLCAFWHFLTTFRPLSDRLYQLNSTDRSDRWNSSLSSSIAHVSYVHASQVATKIAGQSSLCLSGWSERTFLRLALNRVIMDTMAEHKLTHKIWLYLALENMSSGKHRNQFYSAEQSLQRSIY